LVADPARAAEHLAEITVYLTSLAMSVSKGKVVQP
jgi:hypothetical protein